MIATHGATALLPGLAAPADGITDITETTPIPTLEQAVAVTENDDAITLKTGSTAQFAEETTHGIAMQDRTDMIHIETGTTVATDTTTTTPEKSGRVSVPPVHTENATTVRKTNRGRLNRRGNWLPCSRLPPTLTAIEKPVWRRWRIVNAPLGRPTTRRENEGGTEALSTACIGKQ